jgi:hypothetical protein
VATPLDSFTKSTKLRPLIGNPSISAAVTTRLTSIRFGSINGAWLSTVTTSESAPSVMRTSSCVVPPTVSTMPVCTTALKFCSSARIS